MVLTYDTYLLTPIDIVAMCSNCTSRHLSFGVLVYFCPPWSSCHAIDRPISDALNVWRVSCKCCACASVVTLSMWRRPSCMCCCCVQMQVLLLRSIKCETCAHSHCVFSLLCSVQCTMCIDIDTIQGGARLCRLRCIVHS